MTSLPSIEWKLWLVLLVACCGAHGATVTISDLSQAEVQSALAAASNGDTVLFPLLGSAIWTSSVEVTKPLTLIGRGTTLTSGATLNNGLFYVHGFTNTSLTRITGFTFNLVNYTSSGHAILLKDVDLPTLRIDHNTFKFGYEQVQIYGSKGVMDHNLFQNGIKCVSFTAGSSNQAYASWVSLAAGTADAFFVESNLFKDDADYGAAYGEEKIGTYNGGKLVVRYNEFDFDDFPLSDTSSTVMTHGSAGGSVSPAYWQAGAGGRRGQSVVEIYMNSMHGKRIDYLAIMRGSANLVWSNSITGTVQYNPRIYMREEEYSASDWAPNYRTNWPAEDQVHNTFIWANTYRGHDFNDGVYGYIESGPNADAGLLENRDYFLHAPAASGGSESFTGANGASGSYPTDGITYPTLGTMVFTSSGPNAYYGYVPYQYPHPLTLQGTIAVGTMSVGSLRGK